MYYHGTQRTIVVFCSFRYSEGCRCAFGPRTEGRRRSAMIAIALVADVSGWRAPAYMRALGVHELT